MTDLDLDELRTVAEAATAGPWEVLTYDSGSSYRELNTLVITEDLGDRICDTDAPSYGYDGPHAAEGLDARHIATFDPPTVLSLLDRIEELEAKIERITSLADKYGADAENEPYGGELWSTTEMAIYDALEVEVGDDNDNDSV